VPSGKSTGSHEALELRDHDKSRYDGLGVSNAVNNVNTEINNFLVNKDFDQRSLDTALINLDGTENKSRLGANAILGVSMAFAKAVAKEQGIELYEYFGSLVNNKDFKTPEPLLNIINGGKHSNNGLELQEFMIVPVGFQSFAEKITASRKVIETLKKILEEKKYSTELGDEGGFAPVLSSNEEAIELIENAIKNSGYTFDDIKIGIDVAASSFFEDGFYKIKIAEGKENLNSDQMIEWYEKIISEHPIIFLEDPLAENDWVGFTNITEKLGNKIKIVGDDLTVTNVKRINEALEKKAINSVLIKLNQIGTVSETIDAIEMTKKNNWSSFISHRSGETMDTTIADLAVGLHCPYIKAGSLTKPERMCKYERLMEIEKKLDMI
jgi:enolase